MRRQRISRRYFALAAVLLPGLILTTIGNAHAELEFVTQDIGFPVQYFEPVDIEGDGIWELALQVGHTGDSVGVYSPRLQQWIDGPHWLPVEGNNWGCGDFYGDGFPEYAYLLGNSVHLYNPSTRTDSITLTVGYIPRYMQVWGKTKNGIPTMQLCKTTNPFYLIPSNTGDSYFLVWEFHTLHRYSVWGGSIIDEIEASPNKSSIVFASRPFVRAFLSVPVAYVSYRQFYHYSDEPEFTSWVSIRDSTFSQTIWADLHGVFFWPEPYWLNNSDPFWRPGKPSVAVGNNQSADPLVVYWVANSGAMIWYFGGTYERNGYVQPIYDIRYHGIAYYNLYRDSDDELIMPVSGRNLWEIRDPQTGALIDSIPGLPSADIRTAPIMETDVLDLYYFLDSTLYILSRPGMPTDTTEEPEEPQEPLLPTSFALHQNYPNPFNTSTVIKFDLDQPVSVKLDVYNILGQKITTLLNSPFPAGYHQVEWDGKNDNDRDVVSGMYFYRLTTGDLTLTKKMVLLR